jgi:hypothetical protein
MPFDSQVSIWLHSGLGLVPYSHSIPITGQAVPPLGGDDGHEGVLPPLEEPLDPPLEPPLDPPLEPLLPEPPELPPELPLDPELPPELLLEPDPPPELPELELPPSAPPSVEGVNVVPPHAHIAAVPTTIKSFARMSRTSQPTIRKGSTNGKASCFEGFPSPLCRAPDTPVMVLARFRAPSGT